MVFRGFTSKAPFFMKKYFVALDADTYVIDAQKISLRWGQTITDWLDKMKQFDIDSDDLVIGHSVGATVAALHGRGHIIALSPSPIANETKHLITDMKNEDLPYIKENIEHTLRKADVEVYVGEDENEIIKESARILAQKTGGSIMFMPNTDHTSIVEKTKERWADI